ncbi:AraC family transcriptional regulator [Mucilaginibacter pedocola]|uniref:AraC family transcriptional regulator n=1 Tax=Mucilaginibacter pedocola TaxID=1792845 RepID=A0A1S9PDD0_9SPHI|nr:helix-turn-helix domain-containing protein [Mucilaginibacter pedocola]OOQ58971.1 AraC family transcriptional regulator [Mucilaginibacter pedocola]
MNKQAQIPVHLMDDWFAGIYIKSFSAARPFGSGYELDEPHRHDFYYCVLLDKGELQMEVDLQKATLSDGNLFLSYPGQVHRILSANLRSGWFLALDPAIIDPPLKDILDQCLSEVVKASAGPRLARDLSALLAYLHETHQDRERPFNIKIAHHLTNAFTYQLASAYLATERDSLNGHPSRSIEIVKRFRQLIRQRYHILMKPSEFAAEMHISAGHLNDTVREVTGFSVTQHLQQETMREAKRQLYYTDLPIKEISRSLGFDDAQYFTRLFTKITGSPPTTFRLDSRGASA